MGSCFPWYYILTWPCYYFHPSTKKHCAFVSRPLSYDFATMRDDETFRLMFFGDMMCTQNDYVPSIDPALRELLNSADLVIGNCESPVTLNEKKVKNSSNIIFHNMSEKFVSLFLARLGITPANCVLSVANNHVCDQGEKGLKITLQRLKNIGITPIGHFNPEKRPFEKIVRNEITFGIAAWTHWLNWDLFRNTPGVWRMSEVKRRIWLNIKKEEEIDCLIGAPHWDFEFRHFPQIHTIVFVRELMENGFDIIVGHHPHVLQPLEWLDHRLCLYSIGNLNSQQLPLLNWSIRLVCIFEVRLFSSGPNRGRIGGYTVHPFVQDMSGGEIRIQPLEKVAKKLREKYRKRLSLLFEIPY